MTSRIGQYGQARYIKHPPPSATAPFGNGTTIDAGTMIIMDSNVSWLCRESVRQLVWCPGPGAVTTFASSAKVYDGLANWSPGRYTIGGAVSEIPWDRRTAARFGPVPLVLDESNSDGRAVGRVVKCAVDVDNTVAALDLYFAITTSPSADALYSGTYVAFTKVAGAVSGTNTATLTPTVPIPGSMVDLWPCRRNSSTLSQGVYLVAGYLWFGWRPVGGAGTCTIQSCSAWETR